MEKLPNKKEFGSETIVSAALVYEGTIFTGINHAEAFEKLLIAYPDFAFKDYETPELEDGFITSAKRFVTRAEAGEIALQAKQLKDLSSEQTTQALNRLDSKDLDLPS